MARKNSTQQKNKIDITKLKESYKKQREDDSRVILLTKELFMEYFENHPLFVAFFNFVVSNNENNENNDNKENSSLKSITKEYQEIKTKLASDPSYLDTVDVNTLAFIIKWGCTLQSEDRVNKDAYILINEEGEITKFISTPYIYLLECFSTIFQFEKSYNEFVTNLNLADVPQDFVSLVSSMFRLISVKPLKIEAPKDYVEPTASEWGMDEEIVNKYKDRKGDRRDVENDDEEFEVYEENR